MRKAIEMIGKVFGRLTVVCEAVSRSGGKKCYWCECTCNEYLVVRGDHLHHGHIKSCGCLRRQVLSEILKGNRRGLRHGHCGRYYHGRTSTYNIWLGIKKR
ncbi:MAG: hypothetical protein MN733_15180, partial [Nitrososphaera sp.]|nr:hypothetical protein [Nitrososphaera sp.]